MTKQRCPPPRKKKNPQKTPPQKPVKSQKVPNAAIHLCAVVPCQFRTTWRCSPAPAAKRKATEMKPGPLERRWLAKRHSCVSLPAKYVHQVDSARTHWSYTPFSHKCIRRTSASKGSS